MLLRRTGTAVVLLLGLFSSARSASPDYAGDASVSRPATLKERAERNEADRDRLEAEALFCAGRLCEARGDFHGAVRRYRRTLRYDPASFSAARNLVRLLTFNLRIPEEAARHAIQIIESRSDDPILLQRLGIHLLENGEFERATILLERAISVYEDNPEPRPDLLAEATLLRLELGRIQLLLERNDRAWVHFEKAARALEDLEKAELAPAIKGRIDRNAAEAWRLLADTLLAADRLDEAEAAFDQAHRRRGNRSAAALAQARLLEKRGKPAAALEQLDLYLKSPSEEDGSQPYALLGRLLEETDAEAEFFRRLRRLYAIHSGNAALGEFLGERLLEEKRVREAEAVYTRLLQESPTPSAIRRLLGIYSQQKRYGDALPVLATVAEAFGTLDFAELNTSSVADDSEWVDGITATARKTLAENPDRLGFGERLAAALIAKDAGRFDDAKQFYLAAMDRDPKLSGEIAVSWAAALVAADRPGEAVGVLRNAKSRSETTSRWESIDALLAAALELSGETDAAVDTLRRAVRRKPDSPRLQARLGWVLHHAGRDTQAEEAYRALVAKYDDDYRSAEIREAVREAKLILSGLALDGDQADAEEWLEQVLDEFPDDADALNDLAYLWADRRVHLNRALEMARRAVELEPDDPAFLDTLGWALFRLGRYPEARRELEKATALDGADPAIFEHLAETLDRLGEKQAAEEARRAAKEAEKRAE